MVTFFGTKRPGASKKQKNLGTRQADSACTWSCTIMLQECTQICLDLSTTILLKTFFATILMNHVLVCLHAIRGLLITEIKMLC